MIYFICVKFDDSQVYIIIYNCKVIKVHMRVNLLDSHIYMYLVNKNCADRIHIDTH